MALECTNLLVLFINLTQKIHMESLILMITCMIIIISMSQTAMDKFTALDDTTVNQESSTESAETQSFWPGY